MHRPTEEQNQVVAEILAAMKVRSRDVRPVIAVTAGAGTGKTTTCKNVITEARKARFRVLYIVYTKAMSDEAKKRIGNLADVKTTHALAMPSTAIFFEGKKHSNLRVNHVTNELASMIGNYVHQSAKHSEKINHIEVAYRTLDRFKEFLNSPKTDVEFFGKDCLESEGIPSAPKVIGKTVEQSEKLWLDFHGDVINKFAHTLWGCMFDPESKLPVPHDVYLKTYQLCEFEEDMHYFSNDAAVYDLIILDEAQDTNPVVFDMLMRSKHNATVMIVGDPHQNIFSFRDSMNAMSKVIIENYRDDDECMHVGLTGSFRFGEKIAQGANRVLTILGSDSSLHLRGLRDPDDKPNPDEPQRAIICRSNAGVIEVVNNLVRNKKPFCMFGGQERYRTNEIEDVYYLFTGQNHKISTPFIKSFGSFQAFKSYSKTSKDLDYLRFAEFAEFSSQPLEIIEAMRQSDKNSTLPEAIVVTTAHAAKGAEFAQVRLYTDYTPPYFEHNVLGFIPRNAEVIHRIMPYVNPVEDIACYESMKKFMDDPNPEPMHILYVALTRAMEKVYNPYEEGMIKAAEFIERLDNLTKESEITA